MKNIFFSRSFFLFVITAIISMFLYTSCEKEDEKCKAIITAKFLSDTNIVVPLTYITIGGGTYDPTLVVYGITDSRGQFSNEFALEAILDVYAVIDTSSFDTLVYEFTGNTVIRLKPGETIYRSIFLSP